MWHWYKTTNIDIAHYKDLELDNDHIDKLLFIATTYSDTYNLEDDTDDITIASTFLSELRQLNLVWIQKERTHIVSIEQLQC